MKRLDVITSKGYLTELVANAKFNKLSNEEQALKIQQTINEAIVLVKSNSVLGGVSEPFTNKQSHKVRILLKDFYLWMQANDYDHNIPQRVENKAELFLREKNVR